MQFARRVLGACLVAALAVASIAMAAPFAERNLVVSRAQPAAESRVALVIGNGDYPTSPLANSVNDARAVAQRLSELRFQVTRLENATQEQMYDAIRAFGDRLRDGGVGLFYYAGHALQVRGRNYLLPVRAMIQREDEILYRTVDTGQILDKMESARNRANVVILDACRNNPFGRDFRSVATGLAVVDAPYNTLIAFATAPGAVASDGSGRNGLYTQHLLQALASPGLGLEEVFKRVRTGVRQDSAGRQVPWESTSLEVDFYFDPLPGQTLLSAPATPDPLTLELAFWDSVKGSTDAEDYRAYLKRYPEGQFAVLARNRLRLMASASTATQAELPAPVAPAPPPVPAVTTAALPKPTPVDALTAASDAANALRGHGGDVLAAAVSRNGAQALTGSADRSMRQWDLASGRELRALRGHSGAVTAVAFASDPRYLLSGSADRSVRLWNAATGRELSRMDGHGAGVSALAMGPTARYAASAAEDGEVILWEIPSGNIIRRAAADASRMRSLAFSPEGRTLLAASGEGSIRLLDVGNLSLLRSFGPLTGAPAGATFSEDGRRVSAVDGRGDIWVWDAQSGALLARHVTGSTPPLAAAMASDGATALLITRDAQLALWDLTSGRALWRSGGPGQRVTAAALGPRGTNGLTAVEGSLVLQWAPGR